MGTASKYLNGDPMCGQGAGLLLQSPAGEQVVCFRPLKARITVWAALGGGDCKEIQPVHPKGDQSWVLIGRTDAEAETPVLWPPHAKS